MPTPADQNEDRRRPPDLLVRPLSESAGSSADDAPGAVTAACPVPTPSSYLPYLPTYLFRDNGRENI